MPEATATAGPPEDPPGVRLGSAGLRVGPWSGVVVTPLQANSEQVPMPRITAPARRRRATACASSGGRKSSNRREPWVVRLRYAYADTLEAAGRPTEALTWFHRTDAIDAEELTDAAARAASLESASE